MSHFFAYISKMKWINRWGLMKNTTTENLMEHTLEVTQIAHGLCVIKNKLFGGNVDTSKVVLLAMYHETGELITGDLATPIKYYNPKVKEAFGEIEELAKRRIHQLLPEQLQDEYEPLIVHDESSEEYKIVKYADKISAYIKCLQELKWGNKEFSKASIKIKSQLDMIDDDSVRYFIKTFIDSYSLTLDELN